MNRYRKSAMQIMARGDEIIAKKRRRTAVFRASACSCAGICAAVAIALGVWHNGALRDPPEPEKFLTITETTAVTTYAESPTTTQAIPVTTAVTAHAESPVTRPTTRAEQTAVTTASPISRGTVTHAAVTAMTHRTAAKTTPANSTEYNGNVTEPVTQAVTQAVTNADTQAIRTTTAVTADHPLVHPDSADRDHNWDYSGGNGETGDMNNPECHGEFRALGGWYRVNAENEIPQNMVGEKVADVTVKLSYLFGYKDRDETFSTAAELFSIGGMAPEYAAAVRYEGCTEYYVYSNHLYSPADLGELISTTIGTGYFEITGAAYYPKQGYPESTKYQFNDIEVFTGWLEKYSDTVTENYNLIYPASLTLKKADFRFRSELLGLTGNIWLNEGGYVHISCEGVPVSFNIGERAVSRILTALTENYKTV